MAENPYISGHGGADENAPAEGSMDRDIHLKYLIAGENDRLWGLTVNSVGYQSMRPREPYPPANHPARYLFSPGKGRVLDEYQLLYIARGRGVFSSEFTRSQRTVIPVGAGYMFLLFPGEWHSYKPLRDTGWDEYWIGFQGEVIDNRVENGFFNRENPVVKIGISDETVSLYRRAIETAIQQKAGYQQVLAGIVNMMLGMAYSAGRNNMLGTDVENRINRAKIMISERLRDIRPQEIADRLNMSYSSFRKIFREYTGFAPLQYIQELKIRKSKELLTDTDMPIKEIAYRMGFDNHEYFFTAFRKNTGMTPMQYRNITQGK